MRTKKILIFSVLALLIFSSTAYSAQTVTITIGFTKTATVTAVTSVNLDKTARQTINVGENVSFTATIAPDDATDKTVKWSVNNSNVKLCSDSACTTEIGSEAVETLTVYAKGITAGNAIITVTATNGTDDTTDDKTATCEVTVVKNPTLTFDANGGSGTMNAQEVSYNTATALTANAFTRTGYTFNGWNTKSDGTGTSYADGASITITEDTTLYAQWTENEKTPDPAPAPTPEQTTDSTEDTDSESSGGGGSSQNRGYEVLDTDTQSNTETTTTDVTVKGDLTGKDIVEVIKEIETKTEVKTLDLSNVTGVTEVKLPENTKIETLTITENTSIKKVEVSQNNSLKSINFSNSKIEEVNASECSSLETVEVENNEALVVLNVSYSSVTTLNAKNCANLENLNCERCEITELTIEGCGKLSNLDCSYNSLTRLNVSTFGNLSNLACQGQTVRNVKRAQSFNLIDFLFRKISEFFLSDYSEEELKELKYVKDIKAYDESGNEIKVTSDEQGNVTFGEAPAKIKYNYDTGFNNVKMDVTVETSEETQENNNSSSNSTSGSGGGCTLSRNFFMLGFLMLIFKIKKSLQEQA